MKLTEFTHTLTETWLIADGGGETKLGTGCAKQLPGNPMVISLAPGGKPYMDAYWYLKLGPQAFSTAIYSLTVKFPTSLDVSRSNGFEFEIRDDSTNEEEDGGWQADFGTGFWRLYDFKDQRWVQTKIGLPVTGNWLYGVTLSAVYSVALGQSALDGMMFHGLLVDGIWNSVEQLEVATRISTTPKLNMALQLDGDQSGEPYSCDISQAELRILL